MSLAPTELIYAYRPITSTDPESRYWGINQTVKYGHTTIQENSAGIVDTGTTLQFISSDAFSKYVDATGAIKDNTTGLLKITTSQYAKLQPLVFEIGQVPFELVPNAQI
ncbi:hypothetical protein EIP86_006271 [Pleurotus ostreatoroseus]|nr:hypothetical protein EIP86_006271 [Pleurotus ostreatoroseus]